MRVLTVVVLLLSIPVRGADRERVAAMNVAATSLFTWLGCVAHAKFTRTTPDHGRCLAAGAVGRVPFPAVRRGARAPLAPTERHD